MSNILLAGDRHLQNKMLHVLLTEHAEHKHDVLVVKYAEAAAEAERNTYDLFVLDIPDHDFTQVRLIRRFIRYYNTPIIAMSWDFYLTYMSTPLVPSSFDFVAKAERILGLGKYCGYEDDAATATIQA